MKLARYIAPVLLVLGSVSIGGSVRADDADINYDIYVRDSTILVWIDLAPFLSSDDIEQLRDGIDIVLSCRLELAVPKRFFGDHQVTKTERSFRLSHRPVTEDFIVLPADTSRPSPGPLVSLGSLYRYLRDSIEIPLLPMNLMAPDRFHTLQITISSIILTDFNLERPPDKVAESDESPVRYLFRQFLSLTGYGSKEYRTKSRPLTLDEIHREP
jgi:hypothetical protein